MELLLFIPGILVLALVIVFASDIRRFIRVAYNEVWYRLWILSCRRGARKLARQR